MSNIGSKHGRHRRGGRPSARRRWISLTILPLLLSLAFVVSAEAKPKSAATDPSTDPRCTAEPVQIDQQAETTLTPNGTRLLITRATCNAAGGPTSSHQVDEIIVSVNPTGTQELVAFVGRWVRDTESTGSGASKNIQTLELHLPNPPSSSLCVTINGEKTCLPGT